MNITTLIRRGILPVLCFMGSAAMARSQSDGAEIWTYSTLSTATAGGIVSSPAVGPDGTVYFGLEIGSDTSLITRGRLYAISPAGEAKWVFNTDDWIDATPLISADGRIYFGDWDGTFYCLDAATGADIWSMDAGAFIVGSAAQGPDGTLYVGTGESLLLAIDPVDGGIKWVFPAEDWIFAAPVVGPDGRIYVGSWDDRLYAIEPDGRLAWSALTGGDITGGAALMADGTVVVGSRDRFVYAINPDGTLRWAYETGDGVESAPSIGPDGSVAIGSTDGFVYRLSPNGELIWRADLTEAVYSTPSWRADGSVVVGASDFKVHALSASGVSMWTLDTGDWVDATPAVTEDGRIYVTSFDKKLYALNSTAGPDESAEWGTLQRNNRRGGWQARGNLGGGPGRLANLSVRSNAGSGAQTLIAGLVVGGTGSRDLLMRGVGPTLADFGVAGELSDPRIGLFQGEDQVVFNDNWGEAENTGEIASAATSVGAFALDPDSLDAAMLINQGAGSRTLQVTGAGGETGVALVEIYDVSGDAAAELINLSARSQVGTGDGVLIAGLVIDEAATLLIRGLGPTLLDFGVDDVLSDPEVQIIRGTELLAQSSDHSTASDASDIAAAATALGALSLESGTKDAALLVTLPAGVYSAVVRGVSNTTGVALIEVYLVASD
jgi:outer membrane protein assembly factor BamB